MVEEVIRVSAQVSGNEQLRSMASELLGITAAAQQSSRVNLQGVTAGLGTAVSQQLAPLRDATLATEALFQTLATKTGLRDVKNIKSISQAFAELARTGNLTTASLKPMLADLERLQVRATPIGKAALQPVIDGLREMALAATNAQPLQNAAANIDRLADSAARLRPEQLQGFSQQLERISQQEFITADARKSIQETLPLIDQTSELLGVQEQQIKNTALAHRGFAQHTGASAQSLLLLQSATQGVMTAMALLRGNLLFAGFGIIFMRFTVVRFMLTMLALTLVLGGVVKAFTSFTAAVKGAGAQMQKLRFEIDKQLGSARETKAFFRVLDDLSRRLGFGFEEAAKGLIKFQREGLGPLLEQRELVADFARSFGLEFDEAADLLVAAIGRETGALETLGETMGVIPEIFNASLEDLNAMSRGARAEFVINLLRRYQGAAEEFARTLPGALGRVREAFQGFLRDVTEPFARDVLAPAINGLANMINIIAMTVRALKASEPAMRLWERFLANMKIAFQILFPDVDEFNDKIGRGAAGAIFLLLKGLVLLSLILIKLAAFVRLVANAFRFFLGLLKPVIDQIRALAQALKSLNLTGLLVVVKDFFVQFAVGLASINVPATAAGLALRGITLALGDFVAGFRGTGGSAVGRAVRRFFLPVIKSLDDSALSIKGSTDNVIKFLDFDSVAKAVGKSLDNLSAGISRTAVRPTKAIAIAIGKSLDNLRAGLTAGGRGVGTAGRGMWNDILGALRLPSTAKVGAGAKAFIKFFVGDFILPLQDLFKLRTLRKVAADTPSLMTEMLIAAFTAPLRISVAPITQPFKIFATSFGLGFRLVFRALPKLIKSIINPLNILLLVAELFTRGAIEAFVPGKFKGLALLLSTAVFGALSGALTGASIGGFIGLILGGPAGALIGAVAGAVIGAIVGLVASVALEIFLDDRVKAAFRTGISDLNKFLSNLIPEELKDVAGFIGRTLGGAFGIAVTTITDAANLLEKPIELVIDLFNTVKDAAAGIDLSGVINVFENIARALGGINLPSLPSISLPKLALPEIDISPIKGLVGPLRDLGSEFLELGKSAEVFFGGLFKFLTNPLFVLLFGLAVEGAKLLARVLLDLGVSVAGKTLKSFIDFGKGLLTIATRVIPPLIRVIRALARIVLVVVRPAFDVLTTVFRTGLRIAVAVLLNVLEGLISFFAASVGPAIQIAVGHFNILLGMLTGFLDFVNNFVQLIGNLFAGDWGAAWKNLKNLAMNPIKTLIRVLGGFFLIIRGIIGLFIAAAIALFGVFKDSAVDIFGILVDEIVGFFEALPGRVITWVVDLTTALLALFGGLKDLLLALVGLLIDGIVLFFSDMPGLILGALGDLLPFLLEKGIDLVTGLFEGIKFVWEELVKPFFTDLPGNVLEFIGDVVETLLPLGKDLLTGLFAGIQALWTDVLQPFFANLPGTIVVVIGKVTETLKQKGKDLVNGLFTGISNIWTDTVKPWFRGLGLIIRAAVSTVTTTLKQKGKDLIQGLLTGIKDLWNAALGPGRWFINTGKRVLGNIGRLLRTLWQKGKDVLQGFLDGLKSKWTDVKDWLEDRANDIVGVFTLGLATRSPSQVMKTIGGNVVEGLRLGMSSRLPALYGFARGIKSGIVSRMGFNTSTLRSRGINLLVGLERGMRARWPNVRNFADAMRRSLVRRLNFTTSTLWRKGWDFILGLHRGMITYWPNLTGWVGRALTNLIKQFKDGLGVSSPSSITKGFGQDIVRGLIVGMDKERGAAASAFEGILGRPTMGGVALAGAGAGRGTTINVIVQGNVVGQNGMVELAEVITSVQMKRFRHSARRGIFRS